MPRSLSLQGSGVRECHGGALASLRGEQGGGGAVGGPPFYQQGAHGHRGVDPLHCLFRLRPDRGQVYVGREGRTR